MYIPAPTDPPTSGPPPPIDPARGKPVTRLVWLVIGAVALALAAIGAVLPLVPTTPFLLVAAFGFARSSPRLHRWLTTHRVLGPPLRRWHLYGAIGPMAKVLAVGTMAGVLVASVLARVPLWLISLQALIMTGSAVFILTRPNGPPTDAP